VILAPLLLAIGLVPTSRRRHTCVVCRLERVDYQYGPVPISRYIETECALWYRSYVERSHKHVWEPHACKYLSNIFGIAPGWSCNPGAHPICRLRASLQLEVYQHFRDPLEAKLLFLSIVDPEVVNHRLGADDDSLDQLLVDAIFEWAIQKCPGNWPEWWDAYYRKHLVEQRQRAAWLGSKSGLDFADWLAQQGKNFR
jgi:hypothetical protein